MPFAAGILHPASCAFTTTRRPDAALGANGAHQHARNPTPGSTDPSPPTRLIAGSRPPHGAVTELLPVCCPFACVRLWRKKQATSFHPPHVMRLEPWPMSPSRCQKLGNGHRCLTCWSVPMSAPRPKCNRLQANDVVASLGAATASMATEGMKHLVERSLLASSGIGNHRLQGCPELAARNCGSGVLDPLFSL